MKKTTRGRSILTACLLLCISIAAGSAAFGDGGNKRKRHRQSCGTAAVHPLPAVYKENCGTCHMAYGAYLLPEASWKNILGSLGEHFGSEAVLDDTARENVSTYLYSNAADKNSGNLGRKIMKRLGAEVPKRITDLLYIRHKHRKIPPAAFTKPSVGGMGNCLACHSGAEAGDFADDRARIPR